MKLLPILLFGMFLFFTKTTFSQISLMDSIAKEQTLCEKKWKHLDFLYSNDMISKTKMLEKQLELNKKCPSLKYAIVENQDTTLLKNPIVLKTLPRAETLASESQDFIVTGLAFIGIGSGMVFAADRVHFKSTLAHDLVFYPGFVIIGLGSILEITGIAERLSFENKHKKMVIELLANQSLGAKLKF